MDPDHRVITRLDCILNYSIWISLDSMTYLSEIVTRHWIQEERRLLIGCSASFSRLLVNESLHIINSNAWSHFIKSSCQFASWHGTNAITNKTESIHACLRTHLDMVKLQIKQKYYCYRSRKSNIYQMYWLTSWNEHENFTNSQH